MGCQLVPVVAQLTSAVLMGWCQAAPSMPPEVGVDEAPATVVKLRQRPIEGQLQGQLQGQLHGSFGGAQGHRPAQGPRPSPVNLQGQYGAQGQLKGEQRPPNQLQGQQGLLMGQNNRNPAMPRPPGGYPLGGAGGAGGF